MAGSQIVVEHRKELSYLLCQAAEIEHMAMCQYLYAAFSLRTAVGPGLTSTQLEAVERWRRTILEIAAEEMLHWSLVNNILTAIGSAPYVSRPNLPHRAKGYPPEVQFALLGFSEGGAAPLHLLRTTPGRRRRGCGRVLRRTPSGPRRWTQVSCSHARRTTCHRASCTGRSTTGSSTWSEQLGPRPAVHRPAVGAGRSLVAVLARAHPGHRPRQREDRARPHHRAGRGRHQSRHGELALRPVRHDPRGVPRTARGGPGVRAGAPGQRGDRAHRRGDPPAGPFITDATTAAVSDLFNVINDLLLQMLCRYFAFGHETEGQSTALVNAVDRDDVRCRQAAGPAARHAAGRPTSIPGLTAGANFQLAYRSNFLLPHRRAAWIRFVERFEQAATFASEIDGDDATEAVLADVARFLEKTAASLTVHIELLE